MRYDPTISPSPNLAQDPPPAAPAQQQQVANNPLKNDAPVSEIDLIKARKTVKDSIATKKNKLMASVRTQLNKIDLADKIDSKSYIQFEEIVEKGLDPNRFDPVKTKSSKLFDFNLFGYLDLPHVFQNSFSALEKWASILTGNIGSWTSAIESEDGPGSQDEQFNRHVLFPETFMRFIAAENEESLATEETQQYENAAHLTVDTLHAGKPGEARKVGLHIDKLNLDKATIKQLDGLGSYSTIILGNDLAFRIVIDKLGTREQSPVRHSNQRVRLIHSLKNGLENRYSLSKT